MCSVASGAQQDHLDSNQPPVAAQVATLIQQLDSKSFASRESAAIELARLGEPAIGPLAFHTFSCSPEAKWRVKKTLEQICTSGNESVFFKATAILKLRFDVGRHNNQKLAQSLAKLESEWRRKRKDQAIKELRSLGAKVLDPFAGDPDLARMQIFRGGNRLVINDDFGPLAILPPEEEVAQPKSSPPPKPNDEQLKTKIQDILDAAVEENRALAFGVQAKPNASPKPEIDVQDNIAAQIAIRNQIRVNQMLAGAPPQFHGPGVVVTLDEDWNGQASDLTHLNEIDNLQQLTFVDQMISTELIENCSGHAQLTKLAFEDCEFAAGLTNLGWKNVNEVELKHQAISKQLIDFSVTLPLLRTISFDACQSNGSELERLAKLNNLRILQFNETEFDTAIFQAIASLRQVTYLNLTVCKFQTSAYKELVSKRPNLKIAFTAQAFFGVRGPDSLGGREIFRLDETGKAVAIPPEPQACMISDVIAGSGADVAGMKIGDVIQSINGQSMEKFEDLRLHIAQHRVGDKLNVTVIRDEKPVRLSVKLGSQKSAPRF